MEQSIVNKIIIQIIYLSSIKDKYIRNTKSKIDYDFSIYKYSLDYEEKIDCLVIWEPWGITI